MKFLIELYRLSKLLLIALIVGGFVYIFVQFKDLGSAIFAPFRFLTDIVGITKPDRPLKPVEEAVPEDRLRCRAYGMLANLEGAKAHRDEDKVRIMCTIANRAKAEGTDECFVFRRQRELVTPDWGRRQYSKLGVTINVPDRIPGYIERTFSETARNDAMLLAKQTSCTSWEGITLKRPNRSKTLGNQKPDELAEIDAKMVLAVPKSEGSEFEYLKMKSAPTK